MYLHEYKRIMYRHAVEVDSLLTEGYFELYTVQPNGYVLHTVLKHRQNGNCISVETSNHDTIIEKNGKIVKIIKNVAEKPDCQSRHV